MIAGLQNQMKSSMSFGCTSLGQTDSLPEFSGKSSQALIHNQTEQPNDTNRY
jgi:hypothetical protein